MKDVTFEQYQQLVETQSQALRNNIASIAAGNLDVEIEVVEGIKPLSDVVNELRLLVENLRARTAAQQEAHTTLEQRLAERTQALETSVAELQAVQSRYIHRKWTRYPSQADAVQGYRLTEAVAEPTSSAWLPAMTTAVQQVKTATETDDAGQTTLALPIRLHGELIGVLGFAQPDQKIWTEEEIAIVEAVAEQLALALDEQRLFNQTQRALAATEQQTRRLARLNEMSQQLSQARQANEGEVFKIVARHITKIIQADHVSVALVNATGDAFTPLIRHGDSDVMSDEPHALTVGTAIEAAIRENRVIITPDTQASEWWDAPEQAETGIRSTMNIPLLVGTQVIGTLNIGSQEPRTYTRGDEGIMLQVASLLSAAIENKRLVDERQRLATVVENHPDFIGVGTLAGQALYINPAGLTMMGLPPDHDVTAMHANDFYPPAEAKLLLQEGIPAALQRGSWASQANLRRVDGATIPVEQTIGINYDTNGRPVSFSITMRDIRERQAAEAVLAKRAVELETVAVQNARLAEQTQAALAETEDQARRLAALNELGTALSQTTQVDEIFKIATAKTLEIMHSDQASVALLNSGGDTLDIVALEGQAGPIAKEVSLPVPGADFEQVIHQKRLLVRHDDPLPPLGGQEDHPQPPLTPQRRESDLHPPLGGRGGYPDASLPDIRSRMNAPLIAGGRVIGTLNVGSKRPHAYTTRDQNLFLQIASLLASGIESRRLFSRMQRALAETEALYNISAKLNATVTLDEILRAAISPAVERGATDANLFTIEVDAESRPAWLELQAIWEQQGPLSFPPTGGEEVGAPGTRFPVADFPGGQLWVDNPYEPLLIGDISQDKRMDPAAQETYRQAGAQATIILPLAVGQTWVGLMGIHWPTPQTFTGRDVRFYRSLAAQAAVLVNNRLLFQQTQETLAETNALYEVGQGLNSSSSANEMLANLLNVLHHHDIALGANHITLTNIEVDQAGEPEWAENIAAQGPDGMEFSALVGIRYPIKTLAFTKLWTKDPSNPVIVSNTQTDKRLDEGTRAAYMQGGMLASVTLPLSAAGRWIGLLTFGWRDPQTFPDRDVRVYRSLMRQVANFVENQRLFEQTQEALARAEATQRRYTVQAWEAYRTRNRAVKHERVRTGVEPLGDRLPPAVTEAVRRKQTTVVEDASRGGVAPPVNPPPTEEPLPHSHPLPPSGGPGGAKSSLVVPLTLRDEVIGVLGLEETEEARHWSPEEIALVEAVVEQMAEAAEGLRLLDETQKRAGREQLTRQITDKMRASPDIESIIQTGLKELAAALGVSRTYVKLSPKSEHGDINEYPGGHR